MIKLFAGIICILFPVILSAQADRFSLRTYTTAEGLSYNHVRSISQDKEGFLWIATWNGLNCFDGYEFRNYFHIPGDTTSLPEFEIKNLVIDKDNRVWIHSKNKLSLFNRASNTFTTISKQNNYSFGNQVVYSITADKLGNLWVNGDKGISRYDGVHHRFIPYADNQMNRESTAGYNSISFDNRGNLWVGYGIVYEIVESSNLHILKRIGEYNLNFSELISNWPSFNYQLLTQFYISPAGNIWLFTNHGLYCYDKDRKIFKVYEGSPPRSEFDPGSRYIWGGKNGGLFIISPGEENILHIEPGFQAFPSAYFTDSQDNIWFAYMHSSGQGSGLVKATRMPDLFTHYLTEKDAKGQLISVSAITRDSKGNLWVGNRNYDHIIRISPIGRVDSILDQDKHTLAIALHPRAFLNDQKGTIWIGYFRSLLMRYNEQSGKFDREFCVRLNDTNIQQPNMFRILFPLDDHKLLIGSNGYLSIYDPVHKTIRRISRDFQPLSVMKSVDGNYWIGGSRGTLVRISGDLEKVSFFSICKDPEDINIESICEIDSTCLWLSTMGSGICRYNRLNGQTKYYTTHEGLSDNVTYEMLVDKSRNLWISTNKGICRLNPQTGHIRSYDDRDGLKIEEFNSDAAFMDQQGRMYFGGVGGVVRFDPAEMVNRGVPTDHRVLITDLLVSGKPVPGKNNIYELNSIKLGKGNNNIQAHFACIDFNNADKILYRYRLEGVDNDWIFTGSRDRTLSYAGLTPGKYRLVIEATSPEGLWKYSTRLDVIIPPFFYQTNIFRLILAVLFLFMMFMLFRLIVRNTRMREQRKHEQLKLESLQGQMNPHFIFNSLNSINYFISVSDKLAANQYISGFARLMRAFLNNSANEFIPFEKETESVQDYLKLEHLRFGNKFDYEIIIDKELEDQQIEITPSLTQPFIENAIWHGLRNLEGRKGDLKVIYKFTSPDFITCIIEDTGIGRKLAMERKSEEQKNRKSRGIANAMERLSIINSLRKTSCDIIITDLQPGMEESGTRVEVQIPIKN